MIEVGVAGSGRVEESGICCEVDDMKCRIKYLNFRIVGIIGEKSIGIWKSYIDLNVLIKNVRI